MQFNISLDKLPAPPAEALAVSQTLQHAISRQITASGPLGFDRFMQMALYDPDCGYYMAGLPKFGQEGDFVTAPEVLFPVRNPL